MTALRPSPLERWNSLRAQFTAVIFALAFLPNLSLTLIVGSGAWSAKLTLWTLGVGGLCALIGYFLAAAMLEPLTRLRTEAHGGDFETRAQNGDPSEVRALRSAFAGLLSRLATEQARRGAFMATLVHDLKTPLIATGHLAQLLISGGLSAPERQEVGTQMLSENARLLSLVQQMADAHRFERDSVQLHRRPTELRPLLNALKARLAPRAEALGLYLCVSGEGQAEVDASVLERALSNLADNALRYAHSRVELGVSCTGGHIQLSVTDDGPGFAQELHTLAQPFNAQPTTIAGQQYTAGTAGLGLFIARRIAEAHGGELTYHRQHQTDPPGSSPDSTAPHHAFPDRSLSDVPPAASVPAAHTHVQALSVLTIALPEVSHETRNR